MSQKDSRFRYGGPLFSAASALPLDAGLSSPRRFASFAAAGVLRPWRVAALLALLVRTRTEHVFLSGSSAGEALRTYFNQRSVAGFPQNRLCRGVLIMPQSHSEYLRGRRRQALRTNLRGAAAAGIRCEELSERSLALEEISRVLDRRRRSLTDAELQVLTTTWPALLSRPEMTIMVARDDSGIPLAIIGAVIDDMVCLIQVAVASSHHARWALHDHLVRALIDQGVTYLLAEGGGPFGALGHEKSVHHYQHLLGYQIRHLVPRTSARSVVPAVDAASAASARVTPADATHWTGQPRRSSRRPALRDRVGGT